MKVTQAYRYALDPTPGQAVALPWNLYALRKVWNASKGEVAPWWADNSKEAYSSGLDGLHGLARAPKNWAASRTGERKGRPVGSPRFKSKHRTSPSCRFTTGIIRVESDRRHVTLPRLGTIRTAESTRKLARHLERGTGRIMAATIRHQGGRWFVSFTCQIDRADRTPAPSGDRREASARWRKTKAVLAKAHAKVAAQRRDGLHKLTSHLASTYGSIVVEDLNVAGMLANRRLSRADADTGMAEVRRQLDCKTGWNGGRLVVADRWYPSSKRCSGCGAVRAKLPLSERTYTCTACGLILDRDENAARNLAAPAADVAQSCGETKNAPRKTGRDGTCRPGGAGVRPTPGWAVGHEAGTPATGNAGPQGTAA